MRLKFLTSAFALLLVGAAGFVSANSVDKTTVKNPDSMQTDAFFAPIGAGVRIQGPGAFTSVTGAAAAFLSIQTGTLQKTGEGTTSLVYTVNTPGTYYRLFTSVIGGFQFVYAKKWSDGSGTSSNTLTYSVAKVVDGVSSVGLSGSQSISATADSTNSSQLAWKPLFKFTGGLLVVTNGATVTTNVKSNSSITAQPSFIGTANGQAIGFNFGT